MRTPAQQTTGAATCAAINTHGHMRSSHSRGSSSITESTTTDRQKPAKRVHDKQACLFSIPPCAPSLQTFVPSLLLEIVLRLVLLAPVDFGPHPFVQEKEGLRHRNEGRRAPTEAGGGFQKTNYLTIYHLYGRMRVGIGCPIEVILNLSRTRGRVTTLILQSKSCATKIFPCRRELPSRVRSRGIEVFAPYRTPC